MIFVIKTGAFNIFSNSITSMKGVVDAMTESNGDSPAKPMNPRKVYYQEYVNGQSSSS